MAKACASRGVQGLTVQGVKSVKGAKQYRDRKGAGDLGCEHYER